MVNEQRQPAVTGATPVQEGAEPHVAETIKQLLSSMGVEEYEPRVLNQLLDFMYRYVTDILLDAEAYSTHASKPPGHVEMEDVMLAIQARSSFSYVQPPPHDFMVELADEINAQQLPQSNPMKFGLRIPEEGDCLTAPNYQLRLPEEQS